MELIKIGQIIMASVGIINCFLVTLFLFLGKRGNVKANKLLALLLLAICLKLSCALNLNLPPRWDMLRGFLFYVSQAGYLAFGPLLYLYFEVLLKRNVGYWRSGALFLPVLIPFVGYVISFDTPLWAMQICFLSFLIVIFKNLYLTFTSDLCKTFLPTEIFWMKTLFASFTLIWLTVNLLFIDFQLYFFELTAIISVLFYLDSYLVIKQYWLRKGDVIESQKYLNSTLSEEEENDILKRLKTIMDNEKPYTDPEISLPKIAEKIGVKPHKLSQVINKRMNMAFNEYINSYRIADIKDIIIMPVHQDVKIASIAFDNGFNSISAFNTAFKKFTNSTPSKYRSDNLLNILN